MRVKVLTERPIGKKVIQYLRSVGETIVQKNPDIIVVAYYPHILKPHEYEYVKYGVINLHPGYLPYNRGMYPQIWPLVDGTPAGVTIHYINGEIDCGDIIGQKMIEVKSTDTAGDLEKKTQDKIFKLFVSLWPKIKAGKAPRKRQFGVSTYHSAKEITTIQEFDKKTMYQLRACTFDDRSYGYFMDNGKKIYVGIKFFNEEDIERFNRKNHA